MGKLEAFCDNIWTCTTPQKFHGVEIGTRMTIVRLSGNHEVGGKLWIHSAIPLNDEQVSDIKQLGVVAYIVAPNRLHHLYVEDCQKAFPEADTYLAPNLNKKRPDLNYDHALSDIPPTHWQDDFEQIVIQGAPRFNEVVFFHKASKTLITTDTIFNIGKAPSMLTRIGAKVIQRAKPTGLFNDPLLKFHKDEPELARSLKRISQWDFENIILAHGTNITQNGSTVFAEVYGDFIRKNEA